MKVQFSFAREHYIGAQRHMPGDSVPLDAALAAALAAQGVGTCGEADKPAAAVEAVRVEAAPIEAAEAAPNEVEPTPRKSKRRKLTGGKDQAE